MKIRIALPLLCALSFLIVAAGIGSAQISLHPIRLMISFDSTSITYHLDQTKIPSYTVGGIIQKSDGPNNFTVTITTAKQWIISTKINGSAVKDGDIVAIAAGQTPVEVIVTPYAEGPDTESYCLNLTDGANTQAGMCITLAITNAKSAVNADLPIPNVTLVPNPAGNYVFIHGLNNEMAGYKYEIFSTSGAEVRHGMLAADARINIQDLSSGAYRLLLFDGKRMVTNTAITVLH